MTPQAKEQQTSHIIDALNRCVCLLPRDKLENVSSIGLSGQMHGVLFWKAKSGETHCFLSVFRVLLLHEWCNNCRSDDTITAVATTGSGFVQLSVVLLTAPQVLINY